MQFIPQFKNAQCFDTIRQLCRTPALPPNYRSQDISNQLYIG